MRLPRILAVVSVLASPYSVKAGFWSHSTPEAEKPKETLSPVPDGQVTDPLVAGFPQFTEWFRSNGGTLDRRITIGNEPGTNVRGMVATAPIPAETLLIYTPKSLILSSSSDDECYVIEEAVKEMKLGTQSKWHAYFQFDDSKGSHVPTQWDRLNGPGRAMKELQALPPSGETHRHVDWYQHECLKGRELAELEWKGLMMFLTRAADIGLVPMYDLMNHHNGNINTELEVEADGGLSVVASNDIAAGEPIYNSYAKGGLESTVDVFNTYGFVEDLPQLWRWNDDKLIQSSQENKDYTAQRFGTIDPAKPEDSLEFEPNSEHYEVLIVTPELVALSPTKELVATLGHAQRSVDEWQELIAKHHTNLRLSHANALHDSAKAILEGLPTTIEQDEALVPEEKRRLNKDERVGRVDVNKADAIQAIEYRLAFKKALWLATEVAEKGKFFVDSEVIGRNSCRVDRQCT